MLVALCLAKEKLEPPPERVDTVADGLSYSRKGDSYEGGFPTSPSNDTQAAYQSWVYVTERYKDRRSDLASLDALLADLAPTVATCALAAGDVVGATTTMTVAASSVRGQLSARASGAASGLATCFVSAADGLFAPLAHHGGSSLPALRATYTVTLARAPVGTATGVDRFNGIAGSRFGAPPSQLVEGSRSSSHRNATHYTRGFDDNARFLGVPCLLMFSYDADSGLYGFRVRVTGDNDAFSLHSRLKSMGGQGTWDNSIKSWYWRSPTQVWVVQRSADGLTDELTVLHVERAKASGVVAYLPGDTDESEPVPGKLLPRVLRESK